ncbi:MAG: 2,3-bisphosphoglycerate-independent phosphoglycerate mutase [Alphaproteobacteria bacterium]|nr:2,3-bisphosphoglycerate-independent phosphoglycerate mutase [Alphaproteobacteria bacterium]
MENQRLLLCILDGWGVPQSGQESAITPETAPFVSSLSQHKHVQLNASGAAVGLLEGLQGNSEVGHLTIGAGAIYSSAHKIMSSAIEDGSIATKKEWATLLHNVHQNNGVLHIFSLLSKGAIHADLQHLLSITQLLHKQNVTIKLHAILDGRDSAPGSAYTFLETIKKETPFINICSIIGRDWALDRTQNWEKILKAYNMIIHAQGSKFDETEEVVTDCLETEEYLDPHVHRDYQGFQHDVDHFLFLGIRSDRMWQIATALSDANYQGGAPQNTARAWLCMRPYHNTLMMPYLFADPARLNPLGYILEEHGIAQARIAESEKQAHVTFFFDNQKPLPGNTKKLIADSYPNQEEHYSASLPTNSITRHAINTIEEGVPFILINYAASDILGHSGDMELAQSGIACVDRGLDHLVRTAEEHNYTVLITADHGNAECITHQGKPFTSHTTNPVPFIVVGQHTFTHTSGGLSDVAPTVLSYFGITPPEHFTGKSLCRW